MAVQPNKRMQLTKLRAAPVLQAEVPPCAPAGRMDGGTASQLIASVRPIERWVERMTAEVNRLEEQLRRTLEGEAWHGPSVLESLAGLSAAQAASHPIAGAHSIWELVLHLRSDYDLVLRRLAGDGRQLTAAEDWPACPASTEENWQQTVQELKLLNKKLRLAVRDFPDERLDDPLVPEAPYTAYTQFIGVTQHNLYHAGQIALLKRALAATPAA
jgi:uncharacterized damage-inducible protein DinB